VARGRRAVWWNLGCEEAAKGEGNGEQEAGREALREGEAEDGRCGIRDGSFDGVRKSTDVLRDENDADIL
jgi:hypothetical protein